MVNIKKFPRGINSDQVISKSSHDGESERAPGPGLKPQDNNASFEGISEAEYNKRHMKALKDADPGLKPQASSNKGVLTCRAKNCTNSLYKWTSSKDPRYCVDCL